MGLRTRLRLLPCVFVCVFVCVCVRACVYGCMHAYLYHKKYVRVYVCLHMRACVWGLCGADAYARTCSCRGAIRITGRRHTVHSVVHLAADR